jgi:hypothetical protein
MSLTRIGVRGSLRTGMSALAVNQVIVSVCQNRVLVFLLAGARQVDPQWEVVRDPE